MGRILGLDPGTRLTGYGVIDCTGNRMTLVTAGTFRLGNGPLPDRLALLDRGLSDLITEHQPQEIALEKIFFAKNAASALKLGHARGVCMLAASRGGSPLFEYSPTQIKQAVTGFGRAEKQQMAVFLRQILGLHRLADAKPLEELFETWDASDATAIAVCHALHHMKPTNAKSNLTGRSFTEKTLKP